MKTIAYVDGYNFYHGCLKHTQHKWLDLQGLLSSLLRGQSPGDELLAVKFFTSGIKAKLARLGEQSAIAQRTYHRALLATDVQIIEGRFTATPEPAPIHVEGQPVDRNKTVRVWRPNEKQTDVKLALEMYRDALAGRCEQVVLCSNDSDLAPALSAIREDCANIRIGLVLPRPPELETRKSATLEALADWTRHYIRREELQAHQFPDRVPTKKKPAIKPSHW